MNFEALAGQVLVAGFPSTHAPDSIRHALARGTLGGVILFRRNIVDPRQTAALIQTLIADAATPPLVAVDQEGGRVERLKTPVLELPPMRALGVRDDRAMTQRLGRALGAQLRALGFSMNFAPILDVDTNPDNPVIGDRSFGRDPETVITHALAFAEGLRDAGILACGKHFPGHGDTDLDSHLALPTLRHDRDRLNQIELAPFRAATDLPSWMTAHVLFEALDPEVPATLSRHVIHELLREEIGYEGVVISDDLEMKAVQDHWGIVNSGLKAIEAGCDVLLVCSDVDACFELRSALASRAETDGTFRARLAEAAERSRALRAGAPPAVGDVEAALTNPSLDELRTAIAALNAS
ncbi:MAG: beta-N-acetylhexosaminidase [Myxococcota bacterium]